MQLTLPGRTPPPFPAVPAEPTPHAGPDPTTLDDFLRSLREDLRLRPGDVLGAFTIRRLLRTGGMGEAYLAEQAPLGRLTIVKVIRGVGSDAARDRFQTEWRVGGALHHTNLVPVYAAGRKGDRDYYVMPYIRGATLREVITAIQRRAAEPDGGRGLVFRELVARLADAKDRAFLRPWEKLDSGGPAAAPDRPALPAAYFGWVARRMIEAGQALAAAHKTGVLHLDVKPSNILIETPSDITKVLDFGLAQQFDPAAAAPVPCERAGADGYAAPEVAAHGHADARADVYGLGACLYELVTLRKPGTPAPAWAPRDLVAIAEKARAKDPADRYPTAAAFADDVQRWLDCRLPVARNRNWPRAVGLWLRRNTAWAVTGLAVVVGAFGITASVVGHQRDVAERERERLGEEKRAAERERDRVAAEAKYEKDLTEAVAAANRTPPEAGWPDAVHRRLRDIVRVRPASDVRDPATDALIGLDAKQIYRHLFGDRTDGHQGMADVVFSPDGTRVLGAAFWEPYRPESPAVIWDGNAAVAPTFGARPGRGPVAFPDADSPLQLALPVPPQFSTNRRLMAVTPAVVHQFVHTAAHRPLTLRNVRTDAAVLEIPLPGPGFVEMAALSPDARAAAAVFAPYTVPGSTPAAPVTLLWALDRATGKATVVRTWPGNTTALAFSPDGKLLGAGTDDGRVTVRPAATGEVVRSFAEGSLPINGLAFGRNYRIPKTGPGDPADLAAGFLLGVGNNGGSLSVWELRGPARLNAFHGSEHDVFGLAFNPDGTLLASVGREHPFLWDVATGRPVLRVKDPAEAFPTWTSGVAFSPDGRRLAFGSGIPFGTGMLHVFRLDDDRGVRTYRGLTGVIEKVWLSPSGKYVVALSQGWQLLVAARDTGRVAFVLDVKAGWTADNSDLVFLADETQILFASGRAMTRWDLATGARTGAWDLPLGVQDQLAVPPGGRPLLVRLDWDGPRRAFAAREFGPDDRLTEVYPLPDIPVGDIYSLDLSADGRMLAVNSRVPGQVTPRLYDGRTGRRLSAAEGRLPAGAVDAAFNESGRVLTVRVVVGRRTQYAQLRVPDLTPLPAGPAVVARVDDAGKLLLNSPVPYGLQMIRLGEDRPVVSFDIGRNPTGNAFGLSADGRFVYWGRRDGTVCVADVNRCLEQLAPFGTR